MLFKKLYLLIISFGLLYYCDAQPYNNKLNGEWQFVNDQTEYVKVTEGQVIVYRKSTDTNKWESLIDVNTGNKKRKTSYLKFDNNINTTVIEQVTNPKQTITHCINLFYISPYVLLGHDLYYVNRIDSTEFPSQSWDDTYAKSTYSQLSGLMMPLKEKFFKLSRSMAATSSLIKLDTVFNTINFTAIKFTVSNNSSNNQNFSLQKPGDEKAFFITAETGKTYKMLDQYGFGGYTTITLAKNEKITFYVFFEKIPATTKSITIREGNCISGCWNFYDVTLQ